MKLDAKAEDEGPDEGHGLNGPLTDHEPGPREQAAGWSRRGGADRGSPGWSSCRGLSVGGSGVARQEISWQGRHGLEMPTSRGCGNPSISPTGSTRGGSGRGRLNRRLMPLTQRLFVWPFSSPAAMATIDGSMKDVPKGGLHAYICYCIYMLDLMSRPCTLRD